MRAIVSIKVKTTQTCFSSKNNEENEKQLVYDVIKATISSKYFLIY